MAIGNSQLARRGQLKAMLAAVCIALAAYTSTTSAVTTQRTTTTRTTRTTGLSPQASARLQRQAREAGRNITNALLAPNNASQAGGGFQCYYVNDTIPACNSNFHFAASGLIPAPSDAAGKKFLAFLVTGDTACRAAGTDEASCNGNAAPACWWDGYDQQCYGEMPDTTFFMCKEGTAGLLNRQMLT